MAEIKSYIKTEKGGEEIENFGERPKSPYFNELTGVLAIKAHLSFIFKLLDED